MRSCNIQISHLNVQNINRHRRLKYARIDVTKDDKRLELPVTASSIVPTILFPGRNFISKGLYSKGVAYREYQS